MLGAEFGREVALTQGHPCRPRHKLNYPSITKFQQPVELKDYRKPTKKEYMRYVRKLAEHFQCDPATLSENQLREYFLFLREHKHYSGSPMQMALFHWTPPPTATPAPLPPPLCPGCKKPMILINLLARAPP